MEALQHILTHSFHAKALAVRRVTSNRGKNTPGVDGVVWKTAREKMEAVRSIEQRGCRAKRLRRVHIPKKSSPKLLLYRAEQSKLERCRISAIPYFLWANRKPGEMLVRIRQARHCPGPIDTCIV